MRDPSTLSDQISCQPLAPSLDIHHQQGKQLAGYSQHIVKQDHRQPYQAQTFEIPQHELRHGHTAPVGSHINSSSSMEPPKMSDGELRMASTNDTQASLHLLQVQSLIEGCLQRYMNKKEVVEDLLRREKIEPCYTQIVLQKLEEQNEEFFKAYRLRLMVKQQIMVFNKLLEKQVELMRKMRPGGVSSLPVSNGSHGLRLNQNPYNYAAENAAFPSRPDHINQPAGPSTVLINNGSAMPPNFLASADASPHSGRTDIAPNMPLSWPLHSGMLQGSFGVAGKPGFGGYSNAAAAFNADVSVLDPHSTINGDVPVAYLSGTESNLQAVHESFLDPDIGFLGQIPLNFSFSDLPTEFASDEIGNYNQPAFRGTQIGNLQDSREEEGQENKLLRTAFSQGLSYDDLIND